MFSGQGAQRVGMASALLKRSATARRIFERLDETLGAPLSRVCERGPSSELAASANAQPAILACSLASFATYMEQETLSTPLCALGHSLGEISALCAADSIRFEDAVRLVRGRGLAMQQAAPPDSLMLALSGVALDDAARAAKQAEEKLGGCCEVAAVNAPSQVVLSGNAATVEAAANIARARRPKRLEVSAPFHCRLMAPAADKLRELLEGVEVKAPAWPVLCNVDGRVLSEPGEIRERLVRQVVAPVDWVACVESAIGMGARLFVEAAPVVPLAGAIKRVVASLQPDIEVSFAEM